MLSYPCAFYLVTADCIGVAGIVCGLVIPVPDIVVVIVPVPVPLVVAVEDIAGVPVFIVVPDFIVVVDMVEVIC